MGEKVSFLFSPSQIAYVKDRFIREHGRLISDMLYIMDIGIL